METVRARLPCRRSRGSNPFSRFLELLVDYPYLEREDVLAALEYAAAAREPAKKGLRFRLPKGRAMVRQALRLSLADTGRA